MLKAHIDDSGSDEANEHFVLGGLLAPAMTWGSVESAWDALLAKWNLDYFKMSEANRFEEQFAGWEKESRDACVGEFLDVIVEHGLGPAAASMRKADLHDVLARVRNRFGLPPQGNKPSPYPILMARLAQILGVLAGGLRLVGHSGRLLCMFDNQHKVGQAVELVRPAIFDRTGARIAHGSSKDFCVLQAADMWAWSVHRKLQYPDGPLTRIYKRITRDDPRVEVYVEAIRIEQIEELFGDILQSGVEYPQEPE